MKVLKGWSEEIQTCKWVKSDVELDETDLNALLAEGGVEEIYWKDLTTSQKFDILSIEAERLAYREYLTSLKRVGVNLSDDMMMRLKALKVKVTEAVSKVSESFDSQ